MTNSRSPLTAVTAHRTIGAAMLAFLAACAADPTATPGAPEVAQAMPQVAAAVSGPPQFVAGELIVKFRGAATSLSRGALLKAAKAELAERILTPAMRNRGDSRRRERAPHDDVGARCHRGVAQQFGRRVRRAELDLPPKPSPTTRYSERSLWGMQASSATRPWHRRRHVVGGNTPNFSGCTSASSTRANVQPPRPGRQRRHEPRRDRRQRRGRRRQRLRRRHPRLGLRQQRTVSTASATTTARMSPARSAASATTASASSASTGSVKMIGIKFLGRRGGTTANAIKAVDYLTDLKTPPRPEHRRDQQLVGRRRLLAGAARRDRRAGDAGILFIAAAGNSYGVRQQRHAPNYPSSYVHKRQRSCDRVAAITSTARSPLLELRRDHGRHRRARLGICRPCRARTGNSIGLRSVQRHVDGDAARHRRRGAVRVARIPERPRREIKARSCNTAPTRRSRARPSPAAA